jgi:hypothetical protein
MSASKKTKTAIIASTMLGVAAMPFAAAAQDVERAESPTVAEASICYVDVELRQSRFSLNPFSHMKDAINATTFALPTSCETMDRVREGDSLVDAFRSGSFFIDGSLGSWNFTVEEKPDVIEPRDETICGVELELRQSRFSLDPMQHLKDAMNAVSFNWDIPCSVDDNIEVGHDFIEDGFRVGSLIMRGSAGRWSLRVKDKLGPR